MASKLMHCGILIDRQYDGQLSREILPGLQQHDKLQSVLIVPGWLQI